MAKSLGLSFEKIDLHVHTPASYDFKDKTVTPEQIVQQAINAGLRAIAITDHYTGAFIDRVKTAAKGRGLIVFPGVEITCTGGEEGIHVVAILDVDKDQKHIESLLATLDIKPDDQGKREIATVMSPYDVISHINKQGGLAVLAHCTSSKGVLAKMKGVTRRNIFENRGLFAVEAPESDFTDPDKKTKGTRAIDFLSGKDDNYAMRRLAVYSASDSRTPDGDTHTLAGIGRAYTLFKVDQNINLESLRQCFIDRDVRIRQAYEYKPNTWPYISSLSIVGGLFDGQEATFHDGLNSILGGKGAGKSVLVELLRFCLNQPSTDELIFNDHTRKLEKRLETYGKVQLRFIDETGAICEIERTYDPSTDNPYSSESQERLAESFPVLFMSQNEIVRIAEDEEAQIQFIDRFFDFKHYRSRIANIERELTAFDEQFANGLRAMAESKEIEKELGSRDVQLQKIDKLLTDPIYEKYKQIESKDTALRSQQAFLSGLKEKIDTYAKEIHSLTATVFEKPLADDPSLKRNQDVVTATKDSVYSRLASAADDIKKGIEKVQLEYEKWRPSFLGEKKKYEDHVRAAGADKKGLEAQRTKFLKEKDQLTKRINKLKEQINALKTIYENRDALIKELATVYEEYTTERRDKCSKFQAESQGRLKIKIIESTNVDDFRQQLMAMKKGSYLRDADIEQICSATTPHDFILDLLRYQASKDQKHIKNIAIKVKLGEDKILQLCEYLLAQTKFEELLSLQYKAHPQDRPEIRFQVGPGTYELIRDISVGQKCTAMLIMALSDGRFPIIIDQPEDSLDIRSVWDDMCMKIRKGKDNRQFVFTTHSSCLAVASDTDKYIIIDGDARNSKIVMCGALDNPDIKEEVLKYLEGGRSTYTTKAEKYNLTPLP
jgi:ABC-type lipoprotein export system ATPase subunit